MYFAVFRIKLFHKGLMVPVDAKQGEKAAAEGKLAEIIHWMIHQNAAGSDSVLLPERSVCSAQELGFSVQADKIKSKKYRVFQIPEGKECFPAVKRRFHIPEPGFQSLFLQGFCQLLREKGQSFYGASDKNNTGWVHLKKLLSRWYLSLLLRL